MIHVYREHGDEHKISNDMEMIFNDMEMTWQPYGTAWLLPSMLSCSGRHGIRVSAEWSLAAYTVNSSSLDRVPACALGPVARWLCARDDRTRRRLKFRRFVSGSALGVEHTRRATSSSAVA